MSATIDLPAALSSTRIPWAAIERAGYSIRTIIEDAAAHGDTELVRRARRYLARSR